MTLTAGMKLGPYEILSPLGKGGMGEVYLARDSKLDREVAIKVLPEWMTRDPERTARFEREAKLLASLNHPNIAAIHGFDDSDRTRFLVMEYVDGETLGARMKTGPIAVEEALDLAKQIAEALEAAHAQGVIHRDLKPANVMIRTDGTVKVLDFGLAKATGDDSSGVNQENSPTITANFTRPGVVMGTASYMSPEQARGRMLDKRTDIWSFGIMLFECLSGERLFQGETANDSMGAIMHKEPDWSLLPPGTPPTIQLLLRRCLTKDRKRRLHDIADARIELETSLVDPTSSSLGIAVAALEPPSRRLPWRWAAVTAAMFAAIGAGAGWLLKPVPASRVARLAMSIPSQYELAASPYPTLSLDGRYAAFRANIATGNESTLIVRTLDQPEFRALPGTDHAFGPFFSPDGEWLAYFQNNKLKKISMRGGTPITLCDAPSARGGTWLADGTIVFAPESTGPLMRIPNSGGAPEPFTTTDAENEFASHRGPHALPDGRGVLFTTAWDYASWDMASIMVVSAAGGAPRELVSSGSGARYVAPGYLLFARAGTLMAARFDLDQLELTNQPVPVVEGIATRGAALSQQFSVDAHGTLMYMTGSGDVKKRLVSVDHTGKEESLSKQTGKLGEIRPSPDGRFLAMEIGEMEETRIGILELQRDILRILPATDYEADPTWSPDGKWLAFGSSRNGHVPNLYRVRADLSGEVERLTTSTRVQIPTHWSPNGRHLLFMEFSPSTEGDLFRLPLDANGAVQGDPEVFVDAPSWQVSARYSPDGKWIGYVSYETSRGEIFVRSSDDRGSALQISTAGARRMAWSPTEDIIYYIRQSPEGLTMYAVKYTTQDGVLRPLSPETLFTLAEEERYSSTFDITADGERFLFTAPVETDAAAIRREPTIVLNWAKELETLVPPE